MCVLVMHVFANPVSEFNSMHVSIDIQWKYADTEIILSPNSSEEYQNISKINVAMYIQYHHNYIYD